MPLKLHTLWKHVGHGDGKGELHRLVFVAPEENSEEEFCTTASANRAWHGPRADFQKQFIPVSA